MDRKILLKSKTCNDLENNSNNIKIKNNKKKEEKLNLILDLDNTLILAKKFNINYETNKINLQKKKYKKNLLTTFQLNDFFYFIYKRCYLKYFLILANINFNLFIFTNSKKIYANKIINKLYELYPELNLINIITNDENKSYIKSLQRINQLNTDNICIEENYNCLKKNSIIIDDCNKLWPFDSENIYNIIPFLKESNDNYLIELIQNLLIIKNSYTSYDLNIFELLNIFNE